MKKRYAKAVDKNQQALVAALRKMGASVTVTSAAGDGLPDAIVTWRGVTRGLEIKDGQLPPSRRRLSPAEERFARAHPGFVVLVECLEDALEAFGAPSRVRREAM